MSRAVASLPRDAPHRAGLLALALRGARPGVEYSTYG